MLDFKRLEATINMISVEKKISKEKLIETIEAAIKTAYRRDYGEKDSKINVKIDMENETLAITLEKTVVKEVTNPSTEISFEELGDSAGDFEEGDLIEIDVTDELTEGYNGELFGRRASEAARNVIIQKIQDNEKEKIYELFVGKEGKVVNMKVELVEGGKVIFDYNGNQVLLPKNEQVHRDNYVADSRFYIYVAEVSNEENGNPKVILSRKRKELVPALFDIFVPEVSEGVVTIDKIARNPGVKSKMLVSTTFDQIDPVGTLIGQKGIRVKSVMEELSGEKIDIIANSEDVRDVIKRALTPGEVLKVEINEEAGTANVYAKSEEKPKIIGKGGVNINLASELVGYKINVVEVDDSEESENNEDE